MLPVRFKPTISAGERPQTYVLDRAATGTGTTRNVWWRIKFTELYLAGFSVQLRGTCRFQAFSVI